MKRRHFAVFGGAIGLYAGSIAAAFVLPPLAAPMSMQYCLLWSFALAWCAEGRK